MKILVLTEKPSVAKEIARVLGCNQKQKHHYEGAKYVVTWALGHLVTLAEPDDYDAKYKTWNLEDLPIIPEKMKLKIMKETSQQFRGIEQLSRRRRPRGAGHRHGCGARRRARRALDYGADPLEEAVQTALDLVADGSGDSRRLRAAEAWHGLQSAVSSSRLPFRGRLADRPECDARADQQVRRVLIRWARADAHAGHDDRP